MKTAEKIQVIALCSIPIMLLLLGVHISYLGMSGEVKSTIEDAHYQQLQKIFTIGGGIVIIIGGCLILHSCMQMFFGRTKKD